MKNLQTRRKKILFRSLLTGIFFMFFLTNPLTIFAQTKTVTGTVTDETGFLIPGASVVVQGTTIGTVTDASGEFTLQNVPENATLQISFLGYISQNI